jgi:hypothetical protein
MCTNVAYSKREMEIIHAIYSINPNARVSIKGNLKIAGITCMVVLSF